jgi:CPA2 family monovalent cation:H+ antiporter-2
LNGGIIFVLARAFGLRTSVAIETALLLAASGEFVFVILNAATAAGIVGEGVAKLILVTSSLSMFCIPVLAATGAAIVRRTPIKVEHVVPGQGLTAEPRVLVIGYGRVGKLVADMLTRHHVSWIAVERDPVVVEMARREGANVFFGDAARADLLKRCGLDTALAVVVTMDSPEGTEAVVTTAQEIRQGLTIVARARDARQAKRLYELGATDAVPETIEASLQLSESLLVEIGIPMGLVIASIHQRRDEFRKDLHPPSTSGPQRIGKTK